MTVAIERIPGLPGSWYASRPIPEKLARDLANPYFHRGGGSLENTARALWRASGQWHRDGHLSAVDRAHARLARKLVDQVAGRSSEGWVCPRCDRVWAPTIDRCKVCSG